MPKPTAVIVDGATVIRTAFPGLLPRLDVCGAFQTADGLLEARLPADVVVLELPWPVQLRAGMAALRDLVAARYTVCVYSQEDRPFVHAACLASGAAGVVSKSAPLRVAQAAFVEVAGGGSEFPAELLVRLQRLSERGGLGVLSPRERQILAARAHGLPLPAIAALLGEPEAGAVEECRATGRVLREFLSCASQEMVSRLLALDPEDLADIWPTR